MWRYASALAWTAAVVGSASVATAQPFIGDINRWTAQDALDPPAEGAILFVGSSSIRRYEQLALDFADYEIIQRGFGGSQFEDLNRYVDRIVLPYNPSAVVIWEGTNDINSGETGQQVFADYEAFVDLVHAAQPEVEIFWLGIMPTPGRLANGPEEAIANGLISAAAANRPKLHYIDLPAAFNALNPPSDPAFTSLFADSIHLDRQGYELWTSVIRPQIEAVIAPNKVFTPNPDTPQPGSQLLFDFGPSNPEDGDPTIRPDPNGRHWNNWHPAEGNVAVNAGEHLGNLIDIAGNPTGIDLTITGGFSTNGKQQGGLLDPDPALLGDLAVATATQDYFFSSADGEQGGGNDDRPGGFMLDGLDPDLAYDFKFFGSRNTTQARDTEYLVTGANAKAGILQTSGTNIGIDGAYDGNDDEFVTITGIRPDRFGQVFVDLTLRRGTFAYINAMEITVSVPEPAAATTGVLSWIAALSLGRPLPLSR
ncbi:MAG: GDSL-type esterase/lipase family protein [Planctomycetota bacterium]